MKTNTSLQVVIGLALVSLSFFTTLPAAADQLATAAIQTSKPLVAVGAVTCFFSSSDQEEGVKRATKAAEAVALSVGLAEATKYGFGSGFPSAHTAGAFAMATSLSDVKPKKKWLYYGCASLIGWATVKTGGHSWADVVGGAGVGIAVGKLSIKSGDGILIGRTFRF